MSGEAEFQQLGILVTAYLNQDMDVEFESVPQAVAHYAGTSDAAGKDAILEEMSLFESRYHNDLEAEFRRRYWFDFTPDSIGQSVGEFFAMVRAIVADPDVYRHYETLPVGQDGQDE